MDALQNVVINSQKIFDLIQFVKYTYNEKQVADFCNSNIIEINYSEVEGCTTNYLCCNICNGSNSSYYMHKQLKMIIGYLPTSLHMCMNCGIIVHKSCYGISYCYIRRSNDKKTDVSIPSNFVNHINQFCLPFICDTCNMLLSLYLNKGNDMINSVDIPNKGACVLCKQITGPRKLCTLLINNSSIIALVHISCLIYTYPNAIEVNDWKYLNGIIINANQLQKIYMNGKQACICDYCKSNSNLLGIAVDYCNKCADEGKNTYYHKYCLLMAFYEAIQNVNDKTGLQMPVCGLETTGQAHKFGSAVCEKHFTENINTYINVNDVTNEPKKYFVVCGCCNIYIDIAHAKSLFTLIVCISCYNIYSEIIFDNFIEWGNTSISIKAVSNNNEEHDAAKVVKLYATTKEVDLETYLRTISKFFETNPLGLGQFESINNNQDQFQIDAFLYCMSMIITKKNLLSNLSIFLYLLIRHIVYNRLYLLNNFINHNLNLFTNKTFPQRFNNAKFESLLTVLTKNTMKTQKKLTIKKKNRNTSTQGNVSNNKQSYVYKSQISLIGVLLNLNLFAQLPLNVRDIQLYSKLKNSISGAIMSLKELIKYDTTNPISIKNLALLKLNEIDKLIWNSVLTKPFLYGDIACNTENCLINVSNQLYIQNVFNYFVKVNGETNIPSSKLDTTPLEEINSYNCLMLISTEFAFINDMFTALYFYSNVVETMSTQPHKKNHNYSFFIVNLNKAIRYSLINEVFTNIDVTDKKPLYNSFSIYINHINAKLDILLKLFSKNDIELLKEQILLSTTEIGAIYKYIASTAILINNSITIGKQNLCLRNCKIFCNYDDVFNFVFNSTNLEKKNTYLNIIEADAEEFKHELSKLLRYLEQDTINMDEVNLAIKELYDHEDSTKIVNIYIEELFDKYIKEYQTLIELIDKSKSDFDAMKWIIDTIINKNVHNINSYPKCFGNTMLINLPLKKNYISKQIEEFINMYENSNKILTQYAAIINKISSNEVSNKITKDTLQQLIQSLSKYVYFEQHQIFLSNLLSKTIKIELLVHKIYQAASISNDPLYCYNTTSNLIDINLLLERINNYTSQSIEQVINSISALKWLIGGVENFSIELSTQAIAQLNTMNDSLNEFLSVFDYLYNLSDSISSNNITISSKLIFIIWQLIIAITQCTYFKQLYTENIELFDNAFYIHLETIKQEYDEKFHSISNALLKFKQIIIQIKFLYCINFLYCTIDNILIHNKTNLDSNLSSNFDIVLINEEDKTYVATADNVVSFTCTELIDDQFINTWNLYLNQYSKTKYIAIIPILFLCKLYSDTDYVFLDTKLILETKLLDQLYNHHLYNEALNQSIMKLLFDYCIAIIEYIGCGDNNTLSETLLNLCVYFIGDEDVCRSIEYKKSNRSVLKILHSEFIMHIREVNLYLLSAIKLLVFAKIDRDKQRIYQLSLMKRVQIDTNLDNIKKHDILELQEGCERIDITLSKKSLFERLVSIIKNNHLDVELKQNKNIFLSLILSYLKTETWCERAEEMLEFYKYNINNEKIVNCLAQSYIDEFETINSLENLEKNDSIISTYKSILQYRNKSECLFNLVAQAFSSKYCNAQEDKNSFQQLIDIYTHIGNAFSELTIPISVFENQLYILINIIDSNKLATLFEIDHPKFESSINITSINNLVKFFEAKYKQAINEINNLYSLNKLLSELSAEPNGSMHKNNSNNLKYSMYSISTYNKNTNILKIDQRNFKNAIKDYFQSCSKTIEILSLNQIHTDRIENYKDENLNSIVKPSRISARDRLEHSLLEFSNAKKNLIATLKLDNENDYEANINNFDKVNFEFVINNNFFSNYKIQSFNLSMNSIFLNNYEILNIYCEYIKLYILCYDYCVERTEKIVLSKLVKLLDEFINKICIFISSSLNNLLCKVFKLNLIADESIHILEYKLFGIYGIFIKLIYIIKLALFNKLEFNTHVNILTNQQYYVEDKLRNLMRRNQYNIIGNYSKQKQDANIVSNYYVRLGTNDLMLFKNIYTNKANIKSPINLSIILSIMSNAKLENFDANTAILLKFISIIKEQTSCGIIPPEELTFSICNSTNRYLANNYQSITKCIHIYPSNQQFVLYSQNSFAEYEYKIVNTSICALINTLINQFIIKYDTLSLNSENIQLTDNERISKQLNMYEHFQFLEAILGNDFNEKYELLYMKCSSCEALFSLINDELIGFLIGFTYKQEYIKIIVNPLLIIVIIDSFPISINYEQNSVLNVLEYEQLSNSKIWNVIKNYIIVKLIMYKFDSNYSIGYNVAKKVLDILSNTNWPTYWQNAFLNKLKLSLNPVDNHMVTLFKNHSTHLINENLMKLNESLIELEEIIRGIKNFYNNKRTAQINDIFKRGQEIISKFNIVHPYFEKINMNNEEKNSIMFTAYCIIDKKKKNANNAILLYNEIVNHIKLNESMQYNLNLTAYLLLFNNYNSICGNFDNTIEMFIKNSFNISKMKDDYSIIDMYKFDALLRRFSAYGIKNELYETILILANLIEIYDSYAVTKISSNISHPFPDYNTLIGRIPQKLFDCIYNLVETKDTINKNMTTCIIALNYCCCETKNIVQLNIKSILLIRVNYIMLSCIERFELLFGYNNNSNIEFLYADSISADIILSSSQIKHWFSLLNDLINDVCSLLPLLFFDLCGESIIVELFKISIRTIHNTEIDKKITTDYLIDYKEIITDIKNFLMLTELYYLFIGIVIELSLNLILMIGDPYAKKLELNYSFSIDKCVIKPTYYTLNALQNHLLAIINELKKNKKIKIKMNELKEYFAASLAPYIEAYLLRQSSTTSSTNIINRLVKMYHNISCATKISEKIRIINVNSTESILKLIISSVILSSINLSNEIYEAITQMKKRNDYCNISKYFDTKNNNFLKLIDQNCSFIDMSWTPINIETFKFGKTRTHEVKHQVLLENVNNELIKNIQTSLEFTLKQHTNRYKYKNSLVYELLKIFRKLFLTSFATQQDIGKNTFFLDLFLFFITQPVLTVLPFSNVPYYSSVLPLIDFVNQDTKANTIQEIFAIGTQKFDALFTFSPIDSKARQLQDNLIYNSSLEAISNKSLKLVDIEYPIKTKSTIDKTLLSSSVIYWGPMSLPSYINRYIGGDKMWIANIPAITHFMFKLPNNYAITNNNSIISVVMNNLNGFEFTNFGATTQHILDCSSKTNDSQYYCINCIKHLTEDLSNIYDSKLTYNDCAFKRSNTSTQIGMCQVQHNMLPLKLSGLIIHTNPELIYLLSAANENNQMCNSANTCNGTKINCNREDCNDKSYLLKNLTKSLIFNGILSEDLNKKDKNIKVKLIVYPQVSNDTSNATIIMGNLIIFENSIEKIKAFKLFNMRTIHHYDDQQYKTKAELIEQLNSFNKCTIATVNQGIGFAVPTFEQLNVNINLRFDCNCNSGNNLKIHFPNGTMKLDKRSAQTISN